MAERLFQGRGFFLRRRLTKRVQVSLAVLVVCLISINLTKSLSFVSKPSSLIPFLEHQPATEAEATRSNFYAVSDQSIQTDADKVKSKPEPFVATRRKCFLLLSALGSAGLQANSQVGAIENEDDLTSAMFNPDGSLKEGVESEAKFQKVEFVWDGSSSSLDDYLIYVDGSDATNQGFLGGEKEKTVKVSYELPIKWKGPSQMKDANRVRDLYTDLTIQAANKEPVKALTSITIYQSPGLVEEKRLETASTIGIAKALNVIPALSPLQSADLVGGGGACKSLGQWQESVRL